MTARIRFLLTAGLLLAGSVVAQDYSHPESPWPLPCTNDAKPDLASLVPARTLAYLELHQPGKLAEEVRDLLEGSQLKEPGKLVSRLRRAKVDAAAALALPCNLFAPEVLNELGQYEGGLLALTGFTREGTPQIVAILKTGKAGMASLAMRYYLASSQDVEPVGQVRGINIYRVAGLTVEPVQKRSVETRPSKEKRGGVFLAQVPEAIVAGSTRAVVADALHRLRGKSKSPSLADSKAFHKATALRTAPGLFAYADAPRLYRLLAATLREQVAGDEETARQWKLLQAMLNPRAVRFLAGSWSLDMGECRSCLEVRTQDGQSLPALDWLASAKLSDDLLRTVPRDAFCLLAVPVSDTLRGLDVGKVIETSSPGKSLRELEKKLKANLAREVLGRIRTLAVAAGWQQRSKTEIEGKPVVLIEATSEEAAGELEKLWPRLYALGEKAPSPRQVRIREQTIHRLGPKADTASLDGLPSCYARCGKVLVLGWEAGAVAGAVRAPGEERPLLNLTHAQATAQQEEAGVFLLFSCRQMLRQFCCLIECGDESDRACLSYLRRMSRAMKEVPPTVLLVKREGNRYWCEMRQSEMKTAAAPVLNGLVSLVEKGIGFQTWEGGMTLPSPKYLEHPPAYVPALERATKTESPKSPPSEESSEPPLGKPGER